MLISFLCSNDIFHKQVLSSMDLQYYYNTKNFAFLKQIEVIQKFSLDDHSLSQNLKTLPFTSVLFLIVNYTWGYRHGFQNQNSQRIEKGSYSLFLPVKSPIFMVLDPIRVWYPIEPAGPIWFLKLWAEGYYSIKYMTNKNPKNTIPHLSSHSSYPYNLIGHIIFNQNSQLLVDR